MTVIDSKLFLFGGHSGNKHLTDLHVFDTATLRWYRPVVQGVPPPGLRGHTANLIGDRIFLFGGYDGKGRSNDLYILDAIKLKWLHPQYALMLFLFCFRFAAPHPLSFQGNRIYSGWQTTSLCVLSRDKASVDFRRLRWM